MVRRGKRQKEAETDLVFLCVLEEFADIVAGEDTSLVSENGERRLN